MKDPIDTGMNRTGIATSPIDSRRTVEGARAVPAGADGQLDRKSVG